MADTPQECDIELTDHPVASLFPMMSAEEYAALVADIRAHGQREPIWIIGTQILDGRNRYRACREIGIAPFVRAYTGPTDTATLVQFVLSMNLHRRHLSSSQRAVLALEVEAMLAAEARERQRAAGGWRGNRYTGSLAVPELIPEPLEDDDDLPSDAQAERRAAESRNQAAATLNVSGRYVSDAKRLATTAPELIDQIRAGALTITEAKRQLKEREREQQRDANRALVAQAAPLTLAAPDAAPRRYPAIVIDPPWDWGDEGDVDQFGRARPTYHTMTIDQIAALPVADLAERDAHIYLWITNRSLPKGFALLEAWGFRYVTTLTWCKPHFGMGNYFRGQTEHVLFGVRGSLSLLRRDVGTWFAAPRGERHSSKPTAFYELVERCSPGPWLELFARDVRPGWVSWGAEIERETSALRA